MCKGKTDFPKSDLSNKELQMKRTGITFLLFILITGVLASCAGQKPPSTTIDQANDEIEQKVPDWYLNLPEDPNFYFQSASHTSRDMQVAKDKAAESAMASIALDVESTLSTYRSMFQEEVGTAVESAFYEKMTKVIERVASITVQDAHMEKSEVFAEGGVWRAYILYRLPKAPALKMFDDQISQDEEDATRWRESEARKRMYELIDRAQDKP